MICVDIFRIVAQFDPCAAIVYARTSKQTVSWISLCRKPRIDDFIPIDEEGEEQCSRKLLNIISLYPWTSPLPIYYFPDDDTRLVCEIEGMGTEYNVPMHLEFEFVFEDVRGYMLRVPVYGQEYVTHCVDLPLFGEIASLEPLIRECISWAHEYADLKWKADSARKARMERLKSLRPRPTNATQRAHKKPRR